MPWPFFSLQFGGLPDLKGGFFLPDTFFSMSFFFKSKSKSTARRNNWPDHHFKCSAAKCQFPNPPQVAAGRYTCQAFFHTGFHCDGVFDVPPQHANAAMQKHQRLEDARRKQELKDRRDEDARRQAAAEVAAKYEAARRAARNGYRTHAELQQHQPLARRAAQRKHHADQDVPPDYHAYPRRPVAPPTSRVAVQPQQPQIHNPPQRPVSLVPMQFYPNPQPHIRGLPIPPTSSESRVPLGHLSGHTHPEPSRRH
ncbi:hypothetical protein Hypma_006754 [Hypsizygus marmoreus]|uniref:Uncharacterized protein n=1 Tax=Hypsizygus marmoreus TaxID=39966 RepID=A0A369K183_HYPMA|nr:hypothetical protein Hypma_006754 [Hypsizygus marmoreus]